MSDDEMFGDALVVAVHDAIARSIGDPEVSDRDIHLAAVLMFENTDTALYHAAYDEALT